MLRARPAPSGRVSRGSGIGGRGAGVRLLAAGQLLRFPTAVHLPTAGHAQVLQRELRGPGRRRRLRQPGRRFVRLLPDSGEEPFIEGPAPFILVIRYRAVSRRERFIAPSSLSRSNRYFAFYHLLQ